MMILAPACERNAPSLNHSTRGAQRPSSPAQDPPPAPLTSAWLAAARAAGEGATTSGGTPSAAEMLTVRKLFLASSWCSPACDLDPFCANRNGPCPPLSSGHPHPA